MWVRLVFVGVVCGKVGGVEGIYFGGSGGCKVDCYVVVGRCFIIVWMGDDESWFFVIEKYLFVVERIEVFDVESI